MHHRDTLSRNTSGWIWKVFLLLSLTTLWSVNIHAQQCCYGYATIAVSAPSAGLSYTRNTTMTINWTDPYTAASYGGNYNIDYSSNGGSTWNTIMVSGSGSAKTYNWLIPSTIPPGTNYRIRVHQNLPTSSWTCALSCPGISGTFTVLKGCFPPGISTQPASRSACVGSATTFNVTSDLSGSPGTYEWRRDGTTLAITTTPSYTIGSVALSDAGLYDVVLRDDCSPTTAVTTSASCNLTVMEAPKVTVQMPASKTVCENFNDTLRIRAVGAGKTFQWFKDGVAIVGARDSSYVIQNATETTSNGSYACTVTGTCAPPTTSNAIVITVASKPRVSAQPTDLDVCPATSGSISVSATGANLTYQWYKDGVAVPNAFNSTLNFPSYGYASNGQYYCMITSNVFNPNNCQVTAQSKYVRVTGFRPPTVTDSPDTMDACVGSSVTLLSEFQGNGLSYQWFKNGVAVPNAASNSLTISPITAAASGDYYTVATGTCGLTATTKVGRVVVISKPVLSLQPVTQKLTIGDQLTLSVNATDWRTIQWTKNDRPIAGATSPTYVIAKVGKGDAGYYNALVRNSCGGVSSAYANVTVLDPVAPEPALELSTMSVDFGEIPVGYDKSLTLNGLIKNVGTAPLLVSGLSTSPNEFSLTNGPTLPLTLAPGASAGVTIKASPTAKGALSGNLTVLSNSPANSTATVSLMASYVLRYDHAATQDYGVVLTDNSKDACISLTNTSAVSITIDQATFTGTNSAQFSVVTTLPLTIAAGQSADLCVKFMPGTPGSKTATLSIRSSNGGNSSLLLSGVGEAPGGVTDAADAGVTAWPNPMTDRVEVRFANATPAMEVSVVGSTGRTVASFSHDAVEAGGSIRWNGRDASGTSVASGSYTLVIRYGGNAVSLPISIVR